MVHETGYRRDESSRHPVRRLRAAVAGVVGFGAVWLATAILAAQAARERPTTETQTCVNGGCHENITNRRVMHRPVEREQCLDCHEYVDPAQHTLGLITEPQELCWECHDLDFDEVVHEPMEEGNCTGCHDPHGSDHELMLVKSPAEGLCFTCHDQQPFKKKYVHGPVAAGACTACHHPHTSSRAMLLSDASTQLCLGCHTEVDPKDPASVHRHKALEEGCDKCHDPHASDARFQLQAPTPQLCFSCHQDIKQTIDTATVVHGPVVAEHGCTSCHRPHFASQPQLLEKTEADLCQTCHDKPVLADDGRTLTNAIALLDSFPYRHGPIRDGQCAPCHEPHAGDHFRLLVDAYPSTFYVPFEIERYELCFSCHDEDMVMEESGTDFTGFRDGDRNLHWLHVNRKKGRTCRACHDVHTSRHPFQLRETVPFGDAGYLIKFNYKPSDDGGSCGPGCHKAQTYRR